MVFGELAYQARLGNAIGERRNAPSLTTPRPRNAFRKCNYARVSVITGAAEKEQRFATPSLSSTSAALVSESTESAVTGYLEYSAPPAINYAR
ncbi:hypothetical protein WH47_05501 [Habropoda laboriosa]|uniref:Uncharacterized protein n=1 Tax=Habropoda laboriosa TaxID=597456 RepID=A0A0L7RFF1_9HYME|nr:hypothetical protein WH47_05501 [Habropoda laboriosa]